MDYNMQLYTNLTTDSIKNMAVLILLSLVCFFILVKLYNIIKNRRKESYKDKEKIDKLKKEVDELLRKK